MDEQEALARMVPPGQRRPGKFRGGVIQILVTSSCNLSCFNCTQASQLRRKPWFMTPEQFEQAVESLSGYWGVYGVFGGNPAVSPHFEDYCAVLRKRVPREQCGLWCNDPMTAEKGRAMRGAFNPAVSNLNVHLDDGAYRRFADWWPEARPFGLTQDSRHSPPWVAMKDVVADEAERWDLISRCPVNQHWSALIGVFRGELRAWFCEVAAAGAILHQDEPDYPDTGIDLENPSSRSGPTTLVATPENGTSMPFFTTRRLAWWQYPMGAFAHQARKHCHDCGVPMQGHGELAQAADGKEQVSATHAAVYQPKRKGRRVELVTVREQLGEPLECMTRYLQNARR